jgi:hypothetical protein
MDSRPLVISIAGLDADPVVDRVLKALLQPRYLSVVWTETYPSKRAESGLTPSCLTT